MHAFQTFGELAMLLSSLAGFSLMLINWLHIKFSKTRSLRPAALGLLSVGTGILCFAITDIVAIRASAIITAEGSVSALREEHYKGDAYYFVLKSDPPTPELAAYISGLHLENGDLVRASYLSNTGEITSMAILSGGDTPATIHASTASASAYLLVLLAGTFIAIGVTLRWQPPTPYRKRKPL